MAIAQFYESTQALVSYHTLKMYSFPQAKNLLEQLEAHV